jgi:ATP-binding cassette subfamily F protein uup
LDTETLTVLEAFLEDYSGVVITVSHDRYFLDKVSKKLLILQGNGNIEEYYGRYSDYLISAKAKQKLDEPKSEKKPRSTEQEKPTKKKMSYKEKLEWEGIEDKISETESQLEKIQEEMQNAGSDFGKLQTLMKAEQELNEQLEYLMERWEYLSEMANSLS